MTRIVFVHPVVLYTTVASNCKSSYVALCFSAKCQFKFSYLLLASIDFSFVD